MRDARGGASVFPVMFAFGLAAGAGIAAPSALALDYTFTDITEKAGVANADRAHFGATWTDYDGDGYIDLYVVNGRGRPFGEEDINTLYKNNGDGTYTDVTDATGAGDPWVAMRNVWADYDRDGDQDFYSHNFRRSTLYKNEGGVFVDANDESGAGVAMPNGTGAAWVDFDNDGWIDLHATGFANGWNHFMRNNGDGTFSDWQPVSGMNLDANAMGTAWGDYNNDGHQDLAIAAVTPQDTVVLYRSNGDGTFTDVTDIAGIVLEPGSSNAHISWVDYNNDGRRDLFITEVNLGSDKVLPERVYLFRNEGFGRFQDVTVAAGISPPPEADEFWDAVFSDYDNDGDQDLYLGPNGSPNLMYRNNGDGTFTDVAAALGVDLIEELKGVVVGDHDNDGDLDLYAVQRNLPRTSLLPNVLFQNEGGPNHWIQFKLRGRCSNVDAIGARVVVRHGGKRQVRELNGGSGFFDQHSPIVHFGLGPSRRVDRVTIIWPSGYRQKVNFGRVDRRRGVVESRECRAVQASG